MAKKSKSKRNNTINTINNPIVPFISGLDYEQMVKANGEGILKENIDTSIQTLQKDVLSTINLQVNESGIFNKYSRKVTTDLKGNLVIGGISRQTYKAFFFEITSETDSTGYFSSGTHYVCTDIIIYSLDDNTSLMYNICDIQDNTTAKFLFNIIPNKYFHISLNTPIIFTTNITIHTASRFLSSFGALDSVCVELIGYEEEN